MNSQGVRARERVPTGRRGRPSKSMIAAALERPFCAYLHKICLNNRLEGHKYCIDHIMNDKTAPYRQCTFVHSVTGRRCTRAAHKVDRRASPLCQLHRALKVNATPAPTQPTEETSHLEDLAHLEKLSPGKGRRQSSNTFWSPKGDGSAVPSAKLCMTLARYQARRHMGEMAQIELPTMEEIAARHNNADSDTESVDNNQDMFKHASVFTEEELTRTLRDKMIKLRRLYIEQYGHIQYILKEKRLKYIQAQRNEDETFGEIYSFRNYRDNDDYATLRAMLRYHKTFGPESLLQEQAKRIKLSRPPTVGPHPHPNAHPQEHLHHHNHQRQTQNQPPSLDQQQQQQQQQLQAQQTNQQEQPSQQQQQQQHQIGFTMPPANSSSAAFRSAGDSVCIFSRTAQGCDNRCIPLSPYCRQHILYDNKQVLFRPCAGGVPPCLTPVVSFARKNKCWLHTAIN